MITGIQSARHKLVRAQHHIDDLCQQTAAYIQSNRVNVKVAWRPSQEPSVVECEVVALTVPGEVPEEWSLVAGDALTNLRAALDHAVHPRARQFPTLKRSTDSRGRPHKIQVQGNPAATAIVKKHQPYKDNAPDLHLIGILGELVNADKHRQLLVTNQFSSELPFRESDQYEIVDEQPVPNLSLSVGDTVMRFRLRLLGDLETVRLDHQTHLNAEPVIDIPGTHQYRPIGSLLQEICGKVHEIIDELEAAGLR